MKRFPSRAEYPSSVRVNGKKVRIVQTDELDALNSRGMYDFNKKTIYLSTSIKSRKLLAETFIHELLHAIEDLHGIPLKHKDIYELEEPLAQAIASMFSFRFK